ncbi:hypothetical protein Bbelb_005180 [Branchiostoma belcheri]|nr:hypothetical protein Bbelb_005180 [Branchiostoma belcheri]
MGGRETNVYRIEKMLSQGRNPERTDQKENASDKILMKLERETTIEEGTGARDLLPTQASVRPKVRDTTKERTADHKVKSRMETIVDVGGKEPKSHPKARCNASAQNVTATHLRRRHHSDQQGVWPKSSRHEFRKSSEGDTKQRKKVEETERGQMLYGQQGRHFRDHRQYLYRVQLKQLPEMNAQQFHTVFANHPGFDHASIEFESESKGFVYFATHKDAENFGKSVRTVGVPERVDRGSVVKKTRHPEKRQLTFEDKLLALASQVDSGVRQVIASHNEKVEEIAVKVNEVRPSGRFVSLDEHKVREQQRKVLQMKQEELTKQREEFDQSIKTISEELVSLSPDAATRARLLQLLRHVLGDAEISVDTPEVKTDSDNVLCKSASDPVPVQQRMTPDLCEVGCGPEEAEPSTQLPAGATNCPNIGRSAESVVSLVDGAQILVEDNKTDGMATSMASGEGDVRSDVQTEEAVPQCPPISSKEQANILNDLKSRYLRECSRLRAALPMYAYRTELLQKVKYNSVIVVVAETGSGKSTQILQYLADNISEPGKLIACTQPRKIAAISLADRVATEYGCQVGDEIGYAVGSKRRVSDRTKAVFMTDQVLLNSCVKEGELDKYSCVVIDEAHERSIHTDLLLGILKKSLQTRPGLRLIIASATIDPTLFSNYFGGCPVMSVPGRTFPVDIIYKTPQFDDSNVDFVTETVNKVVEIHSNEGEGDILAFLTSPLDIERACERTTFLLGSRVNSVLVLPLHGKLQPEDQRKVFEPAPAGARKVVFATNIAETSVTIPGIIYVVDSGMIKERYFDAKRNLSVLDVKMVAQSSAIQRAGRAGRMQPGTCYRLYTEDEFKDMRVSTLPEILRMHLGMAVLKLMELGVTDVTDFDFVERPSDDALQDAIDQLDILGAIEGTEDEISPLGAIEGTEDEISPKPSESKQSDWVVVTDQSHETTEVMDNLDKTPTVSSFGALMGFWRLPSIISKMFRGKDKQTQEPRMEDEQQDKQDTAITSMSTTITSMSIRLTDLGKKMSQLPTEPRLSKMILEGVNQGCGKEALLVAALASAAGSVYFRAGTEEEKATADRQKMKFCHEGGDLLSMLDVYRDWVAQSPTQRNKWCVANSINAKTMRLAEEAFKEMKHQLASSGVHIPEDFAPVETVNVQLPRLVLAAYCNNLCVFSGHERAGYIVERLQQCVHIHPSSALKHLGAQHKWVVFDEILRTSRDFIINVTPVDIEWLEDVASRYASKVDLDSLKRSTMTSCLIKGYGPEVVRGLIGRRAQTLKSLEAVVSDEEKHLCVIEVDTDRCQVAVFTTQDRLEDGEKIVRDAMDARHNDLKNESDEIPVVDHRGDGTRMVLGRGGEVQDVLMSSEFRCVEVFYKLAQKTVNHYDKQPFRDGTLILKPVNQIHGPGGAGGPRQVELNVMWFRRECKGFGFVECDDAMMNLDGYSIDARRIVADIDGKVIEGGNGIIRASINKNKRSSVYVRGLSCSLNEQTLERTVRRNSVVVPQRYSVVWRPQTSPVDVERDEAQLKGLFSTYVVHGTVRVSVNKPKPESQVRGYAIVTMSDDNDALNAVRGLHNQRGLMGTQALSVERKLQCDVVCNARIYDVLEESFRDTLEDLMRGGTRSVKIEYKRAKSGRTVYFKLSGRDVGEVARATSRLHDVMRPDTVAHEDPQITSRLFNKIGLDFIQTVRNRVKGVHIDADRRTFTVSLYGKDEPRLEAKRLITTYLESLTKHKPREIHLAGSSRPAGVMKALLNKYGLDLDGLKDATGAMEIRFDMRKHLLVVQESDEIFNKVKDVVEECAKEILERKGEKRQREEEDDSEDCPVCFCPIEGQDYRLQCCGHRYCHECIKFQLATAIRSQEFPIRCGTKGCSCEFFLRDLRSLLNQADFRRLVTGSLNAFVNKSGGRYRPCPTPDCPSVYRCVSEEEGEGQVFQCCMCHKRLCTRCHVDMHDGMSCRTWQIFKGDPDATLREWMEGKKDVKLCPRCSFVIEKTAGCNHMTCSLGTILSSYTTDSVLSLATVVAGEIFRRTHNSHDFLSRCVNTAMRVVLLAFTFDSHHDSRQLQATRRVFVHVLLALSGNAWIQFSLRFVCGGSPRKLEALCFDTEPEKRGKIAVNGSILHSHALVGVCCKAIALYPPNAGQPHIAHSNLYNLRLY